jgi:phosphate transport system protein
MELRSMFKESLKGLKESIIMLSKLVQTSIHLAIEALAEMDVKKAQVIIDMDDQIDKMTEDIEKVCLTLIALQQPAASDLRKIGTALKIVTDLERIADLAEDIASIVKKLEGQTLFKPLIDIPKMAQAVCEMVDKSVEAFINEDVALAYELEKKDHEVDRMYRLLFDELIDIMKKEREHIDQAVQLLMVIKALERVGDHSTNVGEWIIYAQTGQIPELNV